MFIAASIFGFVSICISIISLNSYAISSVISIVLGSIGILLYYLGIKQDQEKNIFSSLAIGLSVAGIVISFIFIAISVNKTSMEIVELLNNLLKSVRTEILK